MSQESEVTIQLIRKGEIRKTYGSLHEAIYDAKNGDRIQIVGRGRIDFGHVNIENKKIKISSHGIEKGERPLLYGSFTISESRVELEYLNLQPLSDRDILIKILDNSRCYIQNCKLRNFYDAVILIDSSQAKISNTKIEAVRIDGIRVLDNSRLMFNRGEILHEEEHDKSIGIYSRRSIIVIEENTIIRNFGRYNIWIDLDSVAHISGTSSDSLIEITGAIINNNYITENGILVTYGSKARIAYTKITHHKDPGLSVIGGSHVEICSSIIEKNGDEETPDVYISLSSTAYIEGNTHIGYLYVDQNSYACVERQSTIKRRSSHNNGIIKLL